MVRAIGFDLQALSRFGLLYADDDTLRRCFTAHELEAAGNGPDAVSKLAVRYAAKEAAIKALGGLRDGMALTDIEVRNSPGGAPTLQLGGGALAAADAAGLSQWFVSLSHTDDVVGAVVVAS